jgi:hypothetical protein
MNRTGLLLALIILGGLFVPSAASADGLLRNYDVLAPTGPPNQANITYTFSVPVNLTNVAAPAGTTFTINCGILGAYVQGQVRSAGGSAQTPPLSASGTISATVLVSVHAVNDLQGSPYSCSLSPGSFTIKINTVTGTVTS